MNGVDGSHRSDIIKDLYLQYSYLLKKNENPSVLSGAFSSLLQSAAWLYKALPFKHRDKTIDNLLEKQKKALCYQDWHEISMQLDEKLGKTAWKEDPTSELYDYETIEKDLKEMRECRLNKDSGSLIYLIRTKWTRNLGNMGNLELYRQTFVGTKHLIEEYVEECISCLEYLAEDRDIELDDNYLLDMLNQTRKNVGRTALVLSGGSTFGIFHVGVLITLLETNLLPRIVSGSSAGSIIASILCSHSVDRTLEILKEIMNNELNIFGSDEYDFDKDQHSFKSSLRKLSHFLKYGTFFDIKGLQETMIGLVGELTFKEAYNRTGRIFNITVSLTSAHEQTRLLNHLTAPNCLIWSAVCASCSLPGIFPSTTIYEKIPRTNEIQEWNNDVSTKFVDGSVDNDLPITRLLEMFNVDHIIACQVNPHVVPILKLSTTSIVGGVENEFKTKFRIVLNDFYDFMIHEIIHYLQMLTELGLYQNLSSKIIALISQQYSGDVTILPDYSIEDFLKIFGNPTPTFILDFILRGARASWPKVTVIKNHCGVEFALDKAISILRGRIAISKKSRKEVGGGPSLVTCPVLNLTASYCGTPEESIIHSYDVKSVPPKMRRHNSASVALGKLLRRKNSLNQMSSPSKGHFVKNSSALSLSQLSNEGRYISFNARYSRENPYNGGDQLFSQRLPGKSPNNSTDRRNHNHLETQLKYIKNESVFGSEDRSYNAYEDYYFHRKSSPSTAFRRKSFDYDEDDSSFVDRSSGSLNEKDKPYLPKRSARGSLRNSFTKLNKLRDPLTINGHSNFKESSYQLLNEKLLKLTSPDTRRNFSRELYTDEKTDSAEVPLTLPTEDSKSNIDEKTLHKSYSQSSEQRETDCVDSSVQKYHHEHDLGQFSNQQHELLDRHSPDDNEAFFECN